MIDISKLKVGDVVQHIETGNAFEVVIIDGRRVLAIREIEISNPDEWIFIGSNPQSSKVALYLSARDELPRLFSLVQANQAFFGNPPAGVSCVKLIADKLEELIKASKR